MFGPLLQSLAAFLALAVAFIAAPAIAYATGGRFYIARAAAARAGKARPPLRCSICELEFEVEDMAQCPAYSGRDLLAVLLAGDALPRLLQAPCAAHQSGHATCSTRCCPGG